MDQLFEKKLITTKDAKELSGYSSDYLARLARSGKVTGKRIGHSWLIDQESLTHFLNQQGDRKVDYARALARTREAEYAAHNSAIGRAKKVLTKPLPVSRFSEVAQQILRSQALAFSVASVVVVAGTFVSRAEALSRIATRASEVAQEVATGFSETFGDIPARIESRIVAAKNSTDAPALRVAERVAFVSENISSPALAKLNISLPQIASDENMITRTELLAAAAISRRPSVPAVVVADQVQTLALSAYEYFSHPSNIAYSFSHAYRAIGENTYDAITASFVGYHALIMQVGVHALAHSASARDSLSHAPALVARINLALGEAVVSGSHALIHAEVSGVYGVSAAAPASARATVLALGTIGDTLFDATTRVPKLATTAYLQAMAVPATLAPKLVQGVFGAEYAASSRFLAATGAISEQYLSVVEHTGRFAYAGTAIALDLAGSASSFAMRAPIAVENAYLGMIGRSALALEEFSRTPKVAVALATARTVSAPVLAAVEPALSASEKIAFATYRVIQSLFTSTRRSFANLFAPPPAIVLPSVNKNAKPSKQIVAATTTPHTALEAQNIAAYPLLPQAPQSVEYTTVVQGVSQAFVNQSLASMRSGILATVAGMIQPVASQSVVNNTTVQQVNMIQDLSNLIVRNGDFRGGSLADATSVSSASGNFTALTGGSTTLASTTINGNLTVSGTINISSLSLDSSMTAPYFVANASSATSTFAGSLNIDSGGFVYATSTRNVGIGILSPAALLAIQNSTSTQPIFVAKNAAGTEVYRITNSGFVGIGTSSPSYALAVEGSSSLGNQAIAGYFTATSSSATSTFAGALAVGTSSPISNSLFVVGTTTPLLYISSANGRLGLGTSTPASILDIYATDAIRIPVGTTAERPTLAGVGQVRYNTTTHQFEGYGDNSVWQGLGGVINAAQTAYITAGTDDYLRFVSSSTERMTITSGGAIGVGTTTPFAAFQIATTTGKNLVLSDSGAGANLKHWLFSSLGGSLYIGTTTDAYATSSPAALSITNAGNLSSAGSGYFAGGLGIGVSTTTQGALQTSGAGWIGGAFTANANATLGASSANTLTVNASINSNVLPDSNNVRSLGSVSYYWKNLYVDNITANNISTASTTISGTQANTFTINSDNTTADAEDMTLIFYRGTTVPNATLTWNSAESAKRFEFNQPLFIQNGSASTTLTTFDLKSVAGQTADIFRIASSSGANLLNFTGAGRLGLGTSTPASILDIYATDAIRIPVGTSAERPTLAGVGQVRYNTTTHQFEGYGDNSVWQGLGGVIDADQDTYITADTSNADEDTLRFFTFGSERLTISNSGKVGIGTTTPFVSLQIATSTGKNLVLSDSGAGANLKHWLFSSLGGSLFISTTTDAYATSSPAALTLTNSGSFGLGTTSPAALLSVAGSGYLTGGLGIGLVNSTAGTLQTSGNAIIGGSVGVGGVTSPSYALDVAGFINTDQYSGFKQAGNTVLYASTTNSSTAVGASGAATWMSATTSLTYNTAVGYQALNTTPAVGSASYNTALGALALRSNTAGTYNNAIGMQALTANTTGNYNIANGGQALRSNTTGSGNTAAGYQVLYYNTSATSTTAYGMNAGMGTGAYSNQGSVYVGYQAGYSAGNSSDYNTFLGYQAGYGVTSGARNVIIGNSTIAASYNQITSGSNNIAIGNDVAVANATASNQLNIGNFIYGINLNGTGSTLSGGSIGFGTSSPFAALQIATSTGKNLVLSDSGAGANLKHWLFSSLGGSLYIGTANDSYATSAPALAVTNAGLIGAGTSSPSVALDLANSKTGINIWATTGTSFRKANIGYSSAVASDVFTISTNANTGGTYQDIHILPNNGSGYTGLYLNTSGQAGLGYTGFPDTSIGTALMVNGRLGIGTSSPTGNFSVTANGRATGDLRYGVQIVNSDNANTQATGIAFMGKGGAGGNKWIAGTDLNHDNSNNFFIATSSGPGVTAPFLIGSDSTIQLANLGATPSTITRRLYQVNGALWFDSTQLTGGTSAGYWSRSSGVTYGTTLSDNFGVGTSSAYAKFAIHANNGESNTTLFSIASSTASATTTLFSISNTGNATINGALTVSGQTTLASSLSGLLQGVSGVVSAISGTAGQFPYYNGTNTLVATSSIFLATNGRVAMGGITSPQFSLEVASTTGYGGIVAQSVANTDSTGTVRALMIGQSVTGGVNPGEIQIGIYGTRASGDGSTQMAFDTKQGATRYERMRIDSLGNVIIGSTTPTYMNSSQAAVFTTKVDNNTVFGVGYPQSVSGAVSLIASKASFSGATPIKVPMEIQASQLNIMSTLTGINQTTPVNTLDVGGGIRQTSAVSCALTTNGSGDIICTSDARLKQNMTLFTGGLSIIENINPSNFQYLGESQNRVGFIAQNVNTVLPEATPMQSDGYYGLDTTAILAASVNAIKELNTSVNSILSGTATSTVTNIAYQNASTTATDTLCLGGVCKTAWPAAADLSGYALLTDIPNVSGYATTVSLASYATSAVLASATSSLTTRILALENAGYITNSAITSFVSTSTLASALASYALATSIPDVSSFVSTTTLSSTLASYATSANLASATSSLGARISTLENAGYLTSSAITSFVSTSTLASTLAAYSTTADMNSVIASAIAGTATSSPFVTSGTLSSTLSNYALASSIPSPLSLGNLYGTVTGNIIPDTHNTYDLGTNSIRFANIYAQNIHAGDLTFTETTSAVSGNTFATGDVLALFVNSTTGGTTHTIPIDFRTAINTTTYGANNVYFNTSGALAIGISSTTAPRGKLDVEGSISSGDARYLTLANTSSSNGNAAIPYSMYIPSTTGDLNFASNDNNGALVNTSYSAWNLKIGGQTDAFSISRSPTGTLAYSDVFHISSSGNSGFGTSSPTTRLSVQGNQYTSGTAFFGGAITATSTLVVSGLASFANASSTQIGSTGNAYFATSGGSVGVGTSSPTSRLSVQGDGYFSGTAFFGGAITATSTLNVTGLTTLGFASTTQISSTGSAYFATSGGSVGIGTTNPYPKLEVAGAAAFGNPATSGSTDTAVLTRFRQQTGSDAVLDFGSNGSAYQWIQSRNGSSLSVNYPLLLNPNGGNVGIGTVAPLARLDIIADQSTAVQGHSWGTGRFVGQLDVQASDSYTTQKGGAISFGNSTDSNGRTTYAVIKSRKTNATVGNAGGILDLLTTSNADGVLNTRMTILDTGNVGIGTTNPDAATAARLVIEGPSTTVGFKMQTASAAHYTKFHVDGSGTLYIATDNDNWSNGVNMAANANAWSATSDERLKDILGNITNATDRLATLRTVYYKMKTDPVGVSKIGLIAQDVQAVFPDAVDTSLDGYLKLRYTDLIPPAIAAINELNTRVNSILNGTATSTITNVAYQNASTTATDTLCLGGDCRTVWPAASAPPDLSGYALLTDIPSVSSFVSTSTLSSALISYATSADLASATSSLTTRILALEGAGYLTSSALSSFVSTSTLASTLAAYSTTASMNSAIAAAIAGTDTSLSFVSTSTLSSTLSSYATQSLVASTASSTLASALAAIPSQVTLSNLYGTVTGNIVPSTHNTYDLGTNSIRFANIYAQNIHAGDLTFTETTSAVSGNTFATGDVLALFVNSTTGGTTHTIPIDFRTAINTTTYGANNVYFNTSGALAIGISSTTAPRGKLDVEGSISSGDARFLTLANTSSSNGNAAIPYSLYIPSTTGDLNFASNDNNGALVNTSYSAWNLKIGGQTDAFSISRSPTGSLAYSDLFHVSSEGNIGVGSSTPWAQLSINPNGITGPAFAIGSTTATNFIITNGGSVGIGTTSPTSRFSIQGNQYTSGTAFFGGAVTATSSLTVSGQTTLATSLSGLLQGASGVVSSVSGTAGQFPYYNGTNTLLATSSIFMATNGNVGIGTAGPNMKLSIESTANADFTLDVLGDTTSAGKWSGIRLGSAGSGNLKKGGIIFKAIDTWSRGDMQFLLDSAADTGNVTDTDVKMTILNSGNVGIGTVSPAGAKLVIAGGIQLSASESPTGPSIGNYSSGTGLQLSSGSGGIYFNNQAQSASRMIMTDAGVFSVANLVSCGGIQTNSSGVMSCTSDSRLKDIQSSFTAGLSAIEQISPQTYSWKSDSYLYDGGIQYSGFIAQNVGAAIPQAVSTSSAGYLQVNTTALLAASVNAIKELNTRTKFISNAATSTVLTVDVAGNVGVGVPTPLYALHVAGDIGATSFINTSTRDAKTGISYLAASSNEEMLDQLVNLKVATYRYKIENQNDPLRIGLIAEDVQMVAPEVLSVNGKGVDVYKLATFTLSGVQALAAKVDGHNTRITSLETRVTALENGSISAPSGTPDLSTTTLASALNAFGVLIEKGIAQFNTLVFRTLVASKDADGTSSAGSVVVLAGNTVAQVSNSLVVPSTKVFVTFNSQIAGSWWVSDKVAGSFRVVLSAPQTGDVSFDYFLVQTEGQIATSSPSVAPGVSQSNGPDTVPPVITLLGDNPVRLSVGGVFAEPGVTVVDAADGTDPVVSFINGVQQEANATTIDTSSEKTYIITYSATDRAGNTSTVTRSVIVGASSAPEAAPSTPSSPTDTTPPVVTLTGSAAMQLTVGDTFTDLGATATDDTDGTISAVVSGSVDTATAGLYTLTYTATDAAGNTASVSRVVTVSAPSVTP